MKNSATINNVSHPFEPIYNQESEILILGSFPSVKSREEHFYYGNIHNRFWKVLAAVFSCSVPTNVEQKKSFY